MTLHLHPHISRLLTILALCICTVLPAEAYTVIIDAGHGGKDHGAIDNNMREKDINLGVALKLAKQLRKRHKEIKVVLTRDKDEYLTLQQRADIANKAKGDLFVSIHTNSVAETNPNRTTVCGASTYTLGTHKDNANMEVARRENSVVTYESNYDTKYAGFDPNSDESYIIFEMAQKANMAQSVKFAYEVQKQMNKVAGRRDRGVHQAGFWVLWATSMPAALVELDFICNPNSAKYMGSEQGQDQMARALSNAIGDYFTALAKQEKERLRTEKEEQQEPAIDPSHGVVLEAVVVNDRKSDDAPAMAVPSERTRRPAARRRRSQAAREKSRMQEYEEAVIAEQVQYVAMTQEEEVAPASASESAVSDANVKKQKGKDKQKADKKKKKDAKKQKKDKEQNMASRTNTTTRRVGGKTVVVVTNNGRPVAQSDTKKKKDKTPAPAQKSQQKDQQQAGSSAFTAHDSSEKENSASTAQTRELPGTLARLARVSTVYKIQIYSCDKILKEKDPLFGGLYPVTCSKTGDNRYTYYYGECASQGEIYRLLSDVQKVFPEAKVVKYRRQ